MVFVHGSGGPSEKHKKWFREFNKMGIAIFQLNCFKPRKVSSTVGKQFTVSSGSMTADAFNALKILRNHPRIDANQIGIMGGSKGGSVAMREHGYNNVKVVVYPEAHHSFDADYSVSVVKNGHSYKDCRWLMEDVCSFFIVSNMIGHLQHFRRAEFLSQFH